ncbi:MAG: hypothetical protein H6858_01725 [Rhodospirillales bacterium]|nr:hypothetical protein [Alphaproteobacteria bacterium]MCB1839649.1 hypothetical protein [Alphaproteobacteria bacterium]MCB9976302.1 hypothetical protein [Rhodospirillales bacterium]
MKKFALVALALAMAGSATPSYAAELGKTFFQGKTIVLDDNGTWTYGEGTQQASATPSQYAVESCKTAKLVPVNFCLDTSYWTETEKPTPDYESFYNNTNGSLYFGLITEGLPLTRDFFRNSILDNAGHVAKGGRDGVKVIEDKTVTLGSDTWNYLEYSIDIDGMVFRYSNYYTSVGDKGSIQVLFFTLDTVFETYRKDIEKVANTVKIVY